MPYRFDEERQKVVKDDGHNNQDKNSPAGNGGADPRQGFVNAANHHFANAENSGAISGKGFSLKSSQRPAPKQGAAGGASGNGAGGGNGSGGNSGGNSGAAAPGQGLGRGMGPNSGIANSNMASSGLSSGLVHTSSNSSSNSKSRMNASSHNEEGSEESGGGGGKRTLGRSSAQPDLIPILKRGFIVITALVLVLAIVIYLIAQQIKFSKTNKSASSGSEEVLLLPAGKKLGSPAMHQALMKMAARAVEEENTRAAARLYGHAAEEARLAGAPMAKQYIDALFAQGEVYQYNLSDPDNSRPCFEKVLKLQLADPTTKPAKLANTYNDLADSLNVAGSDANKERINMLYQKAVALAKSCGDTKGQAYYAYYYADFCFDQGQFDKAAALSKDALAAFAKLKEPTLTDLADCQYLAARCLSHLVGPIHFEQADAQYEAALRTYEKAQADEGTYVNCIRDTAWNKLRIGQRKEARELFEKASGHQDDDDDQNQSADSYMNDSLK